MSTQAQFADLFGGTESPPVDFPDGLIGIDEWKQFLLIRHPAAGSLGLLQSLDDERVSLILADPRQLVPNYEVVLRDRERTLLQYDEASGVALDVYCILSVQEEPLRVTANLLGPLVINWETRRGCQLILADSHYDPRYPVVGGVVSERRAC